MHGYLAEFRRLSGVGPSLVEASAGLAPEMLDRLSKSFGTKVTAQDVRFIRFRNYKGGLELEDEAERLGGILTSFDGNEEEVSQLKGFLKKHGAKPMAKSESFDPGEQRAINEDDVGKVIFQQLGGNRIMAMLGRKTSVLTMKNGLIFPLARETQSEAITYSLVDYGQLRSLPRHQDGRASMFDQDGLGIGTERLERFILWPTGVLSPGAMRQWGHHAVAFVGTRHFDNSSSWTSYS